MNGEENKTTAVVPATADKSVVAAKEESYWALVASRYKLIKRILLIALILFIVFFMIFFSRAFTYDSLFSFFKDLQSVAAFVPSDYQTVTSTYHEGEETVLAYRGGVAFVNRKGIEIYSPDGKRLLDVEESFAAPRAISSRKYLLAFDQGGSSFTVTSAYAKFYSGKTDFPIYGAALADSGHFALITGSDTTLSTVLLYDSNFNLIQRFDRASATVSVAISANGKRIALLGAAAKEGKAYTKLDVFHLGESEAENSVLLEGEVPLCVGFTDNRHVAFLTDTALTFADIDLEWKDRYLLNDRAIVDFTVNADGATLALEEDALRAEHTVLAFDDSGKKMLETTFIGDMKAIDIKEKQVFLLFADRVVRYDCKNAAERVYVFEGEARDLFAVSEEGVRVIYPAKAEYLEP